MYKVIYVDGADKIVTVDDNCRVVRIKNNQQDLELHRNGYEELRIGCTVGRYFVLDNAIEVAEGDLLTAEQKQTALDPAQFIYVEPEQVINLQSDYIKLLEEKIRQMETS